MALTKFNYNSFDVTTAASSGLAFNASANGFDTAAAGAMNLIATNTISSGVSSSSFTSGIDSTYDTYLFKFISIHPATDNVNFFFNLSSDGGSNYNITKTSTSFVTFNYEDGSYTNLGYDVGGDLAQSTSGQKVTRDLANDSDSAVSGHMFLFNPSSTTFVKHFIGRSSPYLSYNSAMDFNFAGYGNTTSAINAIQFTMSSGNIDSGVIKMYGITK
jgi:hypothetical protein